MSPRTEMTDERLSPAAAARYIEIKTADLSRIFDPPADKEG